MKDYHVHICFFILLFWDGRALTSADTFALRVNEGENITRSCSFFIYWGITKVSFCREPCGNEDILAETTGGRAQSGRYSIELEKDKPIYVSITNVSKSDSGLYTCAIHRSWFPGSKETFEVQVEEAAVGPTPEWMTLTTPSTTPDVTKPSVKDNQVAGVLLYLCRTLVMVMMTLAAAGLILCRKRDGPTTAKQDTVKYSKRSSEQHPPGPPEHTPEVDQMYEEIRENRVDLTCTECPSDTTSAVHTIPSYPTVKVLKGSSAALQAPE